MLRRELTDGRKLLTSDRDVRRIGWVAAESPGIGDVICCHTAPHSQPRAEARARAQAAGAGFVLIWISTPRSVCEQRDRKGRYARARAGLVTGVPGVDTPYEEPTDADLVLDTSDLSVDEAVERVLTHLEDHGWLELPQDDLEPVA